MRTFARCTYIYFIYNFVYILFNRFSSDYSSDVYLCFYFSFYFYIYIHIFCFTDEDPDLSHSISENVRTVTDGKAGLLEFTALLRSFDDRSTGCVGQRAFLVACNRSRWRTVWCVCGVVCVFIWCGVVCCITSYCIVLCDIIHYYNVLCCTVLYITCLLLFYTCIAFNYFNITYFFIISYIKYLHSKTITVFYQLTYLFCSFYSKFIIQTTRKRARKRFRKIVENSNLWK